MFAKIFAFLVLGFSSPSFALIIDRVEMDLRDPDQKVANQAVSSFEAAMGYRLNVPAIMVNGRRGIDADLQAVLTTFDTTSGYAITRSTLVDASNQKWTLNDASRIEKCLILFATNGYLSAGITRKSIVAHEVFHCFQYQLAGSYNSLISQPLWLYEGSAMFAGEDYVNEASPTMGEAALTKYVTEVKPLFARGYDAYPFYLHLQKEGVNVYKIIKLMLEAFNATSTDLWQIIVNTVPHDALITWASSFARRPEWGRDWDLKVGTFMPDPNAKLTYVTTGTSTLPLQIQGEMGLPRHDNIRLEENQVTKISIPKGVGAIHYFPPGEPFGRTIRLQEGESIQFCMGDNCDCAGADTGIRTLKVVVDSVFVASVSTRDHHSVVVEEGTLFCCGNAGFFDARMVGTWSTGVNKLLSVWAAWPGIPGSRVNTGTGTVEFKISPQGNFVKTYREVRLSSVITNGRDVGNASLEFKHEVTGCITTEAMSAEQGWIHMSNIFDQVEWQSQKQLKPTHPVETSRGRADWFQFSVCVAGPNGCAGTYYFEGDKLRFNGGTGVGMYNDLVKIAD